MDKNLEQEAGQTTKGIEAQLLIATEKKWVLDGVTRSSYPASGSGHSFNDAYEEIESTSGKQVPVHSWRERKAAIRKLRCYRNHSDSSVKPQADEALAKAEAYNIELRHKMLRRIPGQILTFAFIGLCVLGVRAGYIESKRTAGRNLVHFIAAIERDIRNKQTMLETYSLYQESLLRDSLSSWIKEQEKEKAFNIADLERKYKHGLILFDKRTRPLAEEYLGHKIE